MQPLSGIRVVDLSRLLPGPLAGRLLAELGAEVIKIEHPAGGDHARAYPPLCGDRPAGGLFRALNFGKKSVALDLKSEDGRTALAALVASADVLLDSFRPGVLTRLGLDPEDLTARHPRLIYCALTGFGLTGPDAGRAGHDLGFVARSGGLASGGPPDGPVPLGVQIGDVGGGLTAVAGILAALYGRERTGRGAVVDTALLEAASAFSVGAFGQLRGGTLARGEQVLGGSRPCYAVYPTKDGAFIAVAALEPKFWRAFVAVLGVSQLEDAAFEGGAAGARARARIAEVTQTRTLAEWTDAFREVDACVEPVQEPAAYETDAHAVARNAFYSDGALRSPIRLGSFGDLERVPETPPAARALGADTEAILREAGVSPEVIRRVLARLGAG